MEGLTSDSHSSFRPLLVADDQAFAYSLKPSLIINDMPSHLQSPFLHFIFLEGKSGSRHGVRFVRGSCIASALFYVAP
jgi:hypothetical protein